MKAELKQIGYKPETYDKDGALRTPAYFTVTFNIDADPRAILELRKLMGAGTPNIDIAFNEEQPTLDGIPSITEAENPTL